MVWGELFHEHHLTGFDVIPCSEAIEVDSAAELIASIIDSGEDRIVLSGRLLSIFNIPD